MSNWKIKHRPTSLEDFAGNTEIVEAFVESLTGKDKERAYLVSGPYGVGKTTLARIAAFTYLESDDFNTTEINAASDNGIDMVRELEVQCSVSSVKNRVWILDEFHAVSKQGQKAILKLIEEGSDKDFFFICTTDLPQIIPMIRSRCGQFPLDLPEDIDVKRRLRQISKAEGVKVSPDVTKKILEKAEGHVRDAVNFLQKVSSMEEDAALVYLDKVHGGEADSPQAFALVKALMPFKGKTSWKKVKEILAELKENKESPEGLRRMILSSGGSRLLKYGDINIAMIMENFEDPYYDAPTAWPKFTLDTYRAINQVNNGDDIPF